MNFGLSLLVSAGVGLLKRGITEVYKTVLICWDLAVLRDLPTLPLFTSGRCTAIDLGQIWQETFVCVCLFLGILNLSTSPKSFSFPACHQHV